MSSQFLLERRVSVILKSLYVRTDGYASASLMRSDLLHIPKKLKGAKVAVGESVFWFPQNHS